MIGPLFVRASVAPDLKPVVVEILWSVAVPPAPDGRSTSSRICTCSGPAGSSPTAPPGRPIPRSSASSRSADSASSKSGAAAAGRPAPVPPRDRRSPRCASPAGHRSSPSCGTTARSGSRPPATWVRVPWTPLMANRAYLMSLPPHHARTHQAQARHVGRADVLGSAPPDLAVLSRGAAPRGVPALPRAPRPRRASGRGSRPAADRLRRRRPSEDRRAVPAVGQAAGQRDAGEHGERVDVPGRSRASAPRR